MKPSPSDQISLRTPTKHTDPPLRIRRHQPSPHLPDKYEVLLRLFDALESSLKLLRLRKSVPVFSKIRVMVETISDRRLTLQHLAQLKFLLPDEVVIGKVLVPDEKTRCMKYDLHLTITGSNKRKRGTKHSCLRDRLFSRLSRFVKTHPEETEIPEIELPEPFNQPKEDNPRSTHQYSREASEIGVAQASHLPISFNKHFSKKGSCNGVDNSIQSLVASSHLPSVSTSISSDPESESATLTSGAVQSKEPVDQIKQKLSVDYETCSIENVNTQTTPIKSVGTTMMSTTPAPKTPNLCKLIRDKGDVRSTREAPKRPSCARSLMFGSSKRDANIELESDESECLDILDILPKKVLQSLKEKEKKVAEEPTRKLMIVNLPKMFDRIQLLFQNPKSSAIRREALVRHLTDCHQDITDESEVEEQLKLLQEIIPEWIVNKFSPSGNKLCSINKALDTNALRQQLYKSI